jgi:cobalt-zinc-cadmium resistance protein CzcA
MIASLMALSVRMRWAVVLFFLAIAGIGLWQLTRLPIDAVPDITNKQVQINTIDPGLSPVEIEKRVTFRSKPRSPAFPALNAPGRSRATASAQVTAVFSDSHRSLLCPPAGRRTPDPGGREAARRSPAADRSGNDRARRSGTCIPSISRQSRRERRAPGCRPARLAARWQLSDARRARCSPTTVAKAAYLRTVQDWIIAPQLQERARRGRCRLDRRLRRPSSSSPIR